MYFSQIKYAVWSTFIKACTYILCAFVDVSLYFLLLYGYAFYSFGGTHIVLFFWRNKTYTTQRLINVFNSLK